MNGNDIVDLKIARIPTGIRRTRFLDKIFSTEELEIINTGVAGVWTLWAFKEAVYKAHHRRFNLPRSFDPKNIKTQIRATTSNSVLAGAEYMGYKYGGEGLLTSDYVHFTATGQPYEKIHGEIHNTSSALIKTSLKRAVSEKLGLEISELEIIKDDNFIPQIRFQNSVLHLPFSISHHGNYSAFSFQLINY